MNIGLLGGSFDPVHYGHLCAAQDALEHLGLDKVVFIPAAQAPLKSGVVQASDAHRLGLLRCATEGFSRFEISDVELRRGGMSYTIETARHFRQAWPFERLFWIIGADQLARLPLWMRVDELVRLVEFVCLERPGYEVPEAPPLAGLRLHRCPGHRLDISSTDLRERIARNLPVDCFMPAKAVAYLRETGLYAARQD